MKLRVSKGISPRFSRSGFTIIEIAIALGVIAFALVAIMGILPLGLTVQRDNRFETIINQDATYWLEAIRDGAQDTSIDSIDLTNYVERIVINNISQGTTVTYDVGGVPPLDYSSNIVGILTRPFDTNVFVFADVRAFSGSVGEKRSDVSFTYRMEVKLVPIDPVTGVVIQSPVPPAMWEVRLAMSWPVIVNDSTSPKTFKDPPRARKPLYYRTMATRNVQSYVWNFLGNTETNHWFLP